MKNVTVQPLRCTRPSSKLIPDYNDKKNLSAFTRLRVGHSDLRSDRCRHQFNCDSPLCSCEKGHETVQHFLLQCPNYNNQRIRLFIKILVLTNFTIIRKPDEFWTNTLLYGNKTFNESTNIKIMESTIEFVKDSKRFLKIEAFSNS